MKSLLLLLALLIFVFESWSQTFTEINPGIPGINQGSVIWGDYDNDSDLDVFLFGGDGNFGKYTGLFRNDNGTFVEVFNGTFTDLLIGDSDWGDYDNDGDLDIVISGSVDATPKGGVTKIYENTGAGFSEIVGSRINNFIGAATEWGDYDQDGDLDLAIGGEAAANGSNNPRNLEIYENTGTAFRLVYQEINTGINLGSVDWGDYDKDGDLDLLITGFSFRGSTFRNSSVIDNTPEGFVRNDTIALIGTGHGSGEWGDYDNDGDLDILLNGNTFENDTLDKKTLVYQNLDNDFEVVFENSLISTDEGQATWGDYDSDGDLDILIIGRASDDFTDLVARIYENTGSEFRMLEDLSRGVRIGSVSWGDYENDGDLDIILAGQDSASNTITRIYLNTRGTNNFSVNTPPTAPDGLREEIDTTSVTLSWSPSTDNQTSQTGLTYNIHLRSETDTIITSQSRANGFRKVVERGNVGSSVSFSIELEPGTYFWKVQAIDNTFQGSAFSQEKMFTVEEVLGLQKDFFEDHFIVYPVPVKDRLHIKSDNLYEPYLLKIYNLAGVLMYSSEKEIAQRNHYMDLSFLSNGIYLLHTISKSGVGVTKIIKQHND